MYTCNYLNHHFLGQPIASKGPIKRTDNNNYGGNGSEWSAGVQVDLESVLSRLIHVALYSEVTIS